MSLRGEEEASKLLLHPLLTTQSKIVVQDGQEAFSNATSLSPHPAVWSPTKPTSLRAADPSEEWREHFSRHSMSMSEFPGSLSPVNLPLGSDIGDGSLCVQVPLISRHCHRFPSFAYNRL